jgi:NAD(P)-dependent dehydrogenase (short-subunit alcohol dehydrogenase family)
MVAIVTGATGGIGLEVARSLALTGYDVLVAGRDPEKGWLAVDTITRMSPPGTARFARLDLASMASVRTFVDDVRLQTTAVHLLINNAGIMELPIRRLTSDGFEMQFGVNHLGHFVLTLLLLPLLRAAGTARVVTVSSLAHRGAAIDFDNLQGECRYHPWQAYQQSKLANLLFGFELQRRSDANGWGIGSIAAHPGYARTNLIRNGPGRNSRRGLLDLLFRPFSQPATAGALPILYAATYPAAKPMGYYGPNGLFELRGSPAPARIDAIARNEGLARRLWDVSERLTGIDGAASSNGAVIRGSSA